MLTRIKAISKKEFRQLMRDPRMLLLLFTFPIFLLIIFGYAINFDVKHIQIAVYDQDKSEYSREYISGLTSTEYFDLIKYVNNQQEINYALDTKEAQCVIVFPPDFSERIINGEDAKIQFLIDGVDGNTATIIMNYANFATVNYTQKVKKEILNTSGKNLTNLINYQPRFWFNPELRSSKFLIPGLMGMILIITSVVSISMSIVREKEKNTIEQLNVSPLNSTELLIGKIIPYIVIAFINSAIVLAAGFLLFGLSMKGSYLLLFLGTFTFLYASLSMGIFISNIATTQQVAFQLSTVASMMPSLVLSGFIFTIESMPPVIQIFTNVTPAKFYVKILRAILLRGAGFNAIWDQMIYLVIFGTLLLLFASLINKKTRENQ